MMIGKKLKNKFDIKRLLEDKKIILIHLIKKYFYLKFYLFYIKNIQKNDELVLYF